MKGMMGSDGTTSSPPESVIALPCGIKSLLEVGSILKWSVCFCKA
jgi:hypothetical protein